MIDAIRKHLFPHFCPQRLLCMLESRLRIKKYPMETMFSMLQSYHSIPCCVKQELVLIVNLKVEVVQS